MTDVPFTYDPLPVHVVFGYGTKGGVGDELDRLGRRRALVLTTRQQEEQGRQLCDFLGRRCVGHFSQAAPHTPTNTTEQALSVLRESKADCVVSLGGGSTIGLGKALALRTDIDQICIPTTYAGSEMTPILGETSDGHKTSLRSEKVLPEVAIYDVELTMNLPVSMSAASGMNAIAHAAEALYARDRNPVVSMMAEESIRGLSEALPLLLTDMTDVAVRTTAFRSAWLAGLCLGSVGMSLHHKLCHVLGGSFDLPHAETHSIILPHAIAYNARSAPEAIYRMGRALGGGNPSETLFDLLRRLKLPTSLKQIGFKATDIEKAAAIAVQTPYWNPRPVELDGVRDLIASAYEGHLYKPKDEQFSA